MVWVIVVGHQFKTFSRLYEPCSMLIPPYIPDKEYGYSTYDTGWVSGDPCKIPGKQYPA